MIQSLYVHFPFCEAKCHYCDFYSLGQERTKFDDALRFESALFRESELQSSLLAPRLETIFFGGGTPSMTPPDSMKRALEPIWRHTQPDSKTEWTMEANPSSIDLERMKAYREMGVNRISMGVQAMREELLKNLGRVHGHQSVLNALDSVFSAGFTDVSVDLLCGVPNQTLQDLEAALVELTQFPITHLSCYLLTLPPHHRMFRDLPNEDSQLEHLLFIDEFLRTKGFQHYEISNFAKPGHRARHNLNYWEGRSYLGLGPSAHSYDQTRSLRWKNISSLHRYAELLSKGERVTDSQEFLTDAQKDLEKWMLALRLDSGFPRSWLDTSLRLKRSHQLLEQGLLEQNPENTSHLRLTPRGFALSDQIISAFA